MNLKYQQILKGYYFLLMISLLAPPSLSAQTIRLDINPQSGCNYFGNERVDNAIYGFASSREAEEAARQILEQVGLVSNFTIKAANVPNARAEIINGERHILYSQQFMEEINKKTGDYWAKVSILAHEVGHHLQGHTLKDAGNRPQLELEADQFSGFVLYKLGASLEQAQKAVKEGSPSFGTETHPPRNARLEAIAVGYNKARELDAGEKNEDSGIFNPPPEAGISPSESGSPDFVTGPKGSRYPVLNLAGKQWLGENLNLEVSGSYCYDNKPANCQQYGRLYTWEAAKKACTALGAGWRLPTEEEWKNLINTYGGYLDWNTKKEVGNPNRAYTALINGGNTGFSALLGGHRSTDGGFSYLGSYGHYWSATVYDTDYAWYFSFERDSSKMLRFYNGKMLGFSCRCVKD